MNSIKIASIVVELTLFSESETLGQVYKGRRNNADITVVIDDDPRVMVSATDLGGNWLSDGSAKRVRFT
jgi:hypothetical protein